VKEMAALSQRTLFTAVLNNIVTADHVFHRRHLLHEPSKRLALHPVRSDVADNISFVF
jgi:hypothetical protein